MTMRPQAIDRFLCDQMGYDPRCVPFRALQRHVRERMKICGIPDEEAYLALVTENEEERDELLEALLVPETWFFRDFEPFVFLREYIRRKRFPAPGGGRPWRILSLPCSTGEEPYSVAMTLMEAGLEGSQFHIDAVEISRKALEKAERGIFGPSCFREQDEDLRRKYFEKSGRSYRLPPRVRGAVRFIRGNLLDPGGLAVNGPYDIVFFRNLLIYFSDQARARATETIDGLLACGGLLFLGYAEPSHIFFPGYIPVDHPRSYACLKPESAPVEAHRPLSPRCGTGEQPGNEGRKGFPSRVPGDRPGAEGPCASTRSPRSSADDRIQGTGTPMGAPGGRESLGLPSLIEATGSEDRKRRTEALLESARGLADAGMLREAGERCLECLELDVTCCEAHFILGIVQWAMGDAEGADRSLQKALYLDPDHLDALFHLSLLLEERGLAEGADRCRERMERIKRREMSG